MPTATEAHRPWLPEQSARGQQNEPVAGRWSWKIGRVFGMDLYIHATFVLLLGWVAFSHLAGGAVAIYRGLALVVAVFTIVVMHELGHALMARRFGIRTRDITLLPIGGVSRLERIPEKPIEELLVTAAGPAVNVVLALLLWAVLGFAGVSTSPAGIAVVGGSFLTKLMWVNVTLAVFNLLPAFPMDGGRVLRAALALKMDHVHATEIAARLGQGMALLFGGLGLFFNPILLFIAIFVWMGARQESTMVGLKRALSGVPIGSAMVTEFRVLAPSDRLSSAAEHIVAGFQHDFPVVDGTRLVGVLTRSDVVRGLSADGGEASVASAMHRGFATAHPTDMLEGVLSGIQLPEAVPIVVVRDDAVVGIMTAENIGEFILMQGARRAGTERAGERSEPPV
ncbi:MAG TPA: site-2 protease family protein [Polyangiaceae bacterium]|nr:site-2 protease family protein [Polyangiaceae bacterium]